MVHTSRKLIPESEFIQVFKDKCRRLNTEEESGKEKDKAITVVDSAASNEEWVVY